MIDVRRAWKKVQNIKCRVYIYSGVRLVNLTIFWWVFDIWSNCEAVPWGGGASTPPKLHEHTAHARARGDFAEYSLAAAAAAAAMCAAAAAVRCAYGW